MSTRFWATACEYDHIQQAEGIHISIQVVCRLRMRRDHYELAGRVQNHHVIFSFHRKGHNLS